MNSVVAGKRQSFFRRCWSGTARLWQAYWLVGVLGQFIVLFVTVAITYPFRSGIQENLWTAIVNLILILINLVLILIYFVYASVSIWRCAPNANNQVWGALARVTVLISWAYGVVAVWRAL